VRAFEGLKGSAGTGGLKRGSLPVSTALPQAAMHKAISVAAMIGLLLLIDIRVLEDRQIERYFLG
jgi:hypothetical protein